MANASELGIEESNNRSRAIRYGHVVRIVGTQNFPISIVKTGRIFGGSCRIYFGNEAQ